MEPTATPNSGNDPLAGANIGRRDTSVEIASKQAVSLLAEQVNNNQLPLDLAFKAVADAANNPEVKAAYSHMAEVLKNQSLQFPKAEMSKFPNVFDRSLGAMISSGLAGGVLDIVLDRAARCLNAEVPDGPELEQRKWALRLGVLVSSGVPILEAMRISETVVRDAGFLNLLKDAFDRVRAGDAIANTEIFNLSADLNAALDRGENTGDLDTELIAYSKSNYRSSSEPAPAT